MRADGPDMMLRLVDSGGGILAIEIFDWLSLLSALLMVFPA